MQYRIFCPTPAVRSLDARNRKCMLRLGYRQVDGNRTKVVAVLYNVASKDVGK